MSTDKTVFSIMLNSPLYRRVLLAGLLFTVCLAAACWRFAPLDPWKESEELLNLLQVMRTSPLAPLVVISSYVIGGLLVFPVMVLIPPALSQAVIRISRRSEPGGTVYAPTGSPESVIQPVVASLSTL